MKSQPPDALVHSPVRWTDEVVLAAFRKHQESPVDIKPHLPPKISNRYIVVGGNGFVGEKIGLSCDFHD